MAEVIFRYPAGMAPEDRYAPRIEAVGRRFMPTLFTPDRLHEITDPNFIEYNAAGAITLRGLQELLDYRAQFGGPKLLRAEIIPVPRRQSPIVPLTGGEQYNFSSVTEFTFTLPPDAPQFPTRVRMWESLDVDPERAIVLGRTYRPLGATGLLTETNQHDFVAEQVQYFIDNGEPMPMPPIEDVYRAVFPGVSFEAPAR